MLIRIYGGMSQCDLPQMMGDHDGTAYDTVGGGIAVRCIARRRVVVEDSDTDGGGVDRVVGNNSRAGGIAGQRFSGHLR